MPGGWSKPRDPAKLADTRAEFNFDIPVGELPGMPAELIGAEGPLQVSLRFEREQTMPVAHVAVRGTLLLACQRCLVPMKYLVDADASVVLVTSEAEADRVPEGMETFLAADGQVTGAALAAEEVMLALPAVARHAEHECRIGTVPEAAVEAAPVAEDQETQRPFADLRNLLRDRNAD